MLPDKIEVKGNESPFDSDIWDLNKLCPTLHRGGGSRYLVFTQISQDWLRYAAKKFFKYSISTRTTANTISAQFIEIRNFSVFLAEKYFFINSNDLSRNVVLDYLSHQSTQGFKESTRKARCSHLKLFLDLCYSEKWLDIPPYLITNKDYPSGIRANPKYIPEDVVSQILEHIDSLPSHVAAMTKVLLECGMRISELCWLKTDCLIQDAQGDFFLRYFQYKAKKEHIVPVSKELVKVIQVQLELVKKTYGSEFEFLFPGFGNRVKNNPLPLSTRGYRSYLSKFSKEKDIRDSSGKLWNLHPHQFRHTVGTRMINNGVPQHMIQKFLGHGSPEMTMRYAHIHDQTLKNEISKYHDTRIVNISGETIKSEIPEIDTDEELQFFKKKILTQALPNGYCGRPVLKGPCPHANACLTCGDFRTTKEFLGIHKEELERTEKVIQKALENGWQRQIEMNETVKVNLENIIKVLETDNE